jgi:hypothetical protein
MLWAYCFLRRLSASSVSPRWALGLPLGSFLALAVPGDLKKIEAKFFAVQMLLFAVSGAAFMGAGKGC